MQTYNLFNIDKTFNIAKVAVPTEDSLNSVGVKLRYLKSQLLANLNVNQSFCNILSPIIDDIAYSSAVSIMQYDRTPENPEYALGLTVLNDLRNFFTSNGYYVSSGHRTMTFTAGNGSAYVLAFVEQGSSNGLFCEYVDDEDVSHLVGLITTDASMNILLSDILTNKYEQSYTLSQLLIDLNNSIEIQTMMHDSIIISDDINIKYDLSNLLAQYEDRSTDVIEYARTLRAAAAAGGVLSVLNTISKTYKNLSEVSADNNTGLINYIDYEVWMPRSFMVGTISAIITSISAIVTAIASAINIVIGAIAAAVSLIINLITSFIQFKTNNLYAKLSDGLNTFPAYAIPIVARQSERNSAVYNGSQAAFVDAINYNGVPLLCHGFGMWLIGSFDNSGSNKIVRWNGFVDAKDRRSIIASNISVETWTPSVDPGVISPSRDEYSVNISNVVSYATNPDADQHFTTYQPSYSNDGHMTDASDGEFRLIICANIIFSILGWSYNMLQTGDQQDFKINLISGAPSNVDTLYGISRHTASWWSMTDKFYNAFVKVIGRALYCLYNNVAYDNYLIPTWAEISTLCDLMNKNQILRFVMTPIGGYSTVVWRPISGSYRISDTELAMYDTILPYEDAFSPGLIPPNYDTKEVVLTLALLGAATIAAVVATVVVAVNVKKNIQKKRAKLAAKVEKAHNDFIEDPTSDEKYVAYRKAVTQNNLSAMLLGGTRYSKVNYWDSSTSEPSNSLYSKIKNAIITDNNICEYNFDTIVKLIKG